MARHVIQCIIPAGPCETCEEHDCCCDPKCAGALRARVAELEAALKPFAEFKFRAKSVYRNIFAERGESIVLCGYDDSGNVTGIDVKFSDFMKARTILSKEVKRE